MKKQNFLVGLFTLFLSLSASANSVFCEEQSGSAYPLSVSISPTSTSGVYAAFVTRQGPQAASGRVSNVTASVTSDGSTVFHTPNGLFSILITKQVTPGNGGYISQMTVALVTATSTQWLVTGTKAICN